MIRNTLWKKFLTRLQSFSYVSYRLYFVKARKEKCQFSYLYADCIIFDALFKVWTPYISSGLFKVLLASPTFTELQIFKAQSCSRQVRFGSVHPWVWDWHYGPRYLEMHIKEDCVPMNSQSDGYNTAAEEKPIPAARQVSKYI